MTTVTTPRPWTYTLQLPHDPIAPRIARSTLRAVLTGHGMSKLREKAELLTSELVTNAYLHSDGPCSMRLHPVEEDRLRVAVADTNPALPPLFDTVVPAPPAEPPPGDTAAHGRGLLLVRLCADDWGGYRFGDGTSGTGGKLLWFEISGHSGTRGAFDITA